MWTGKNPVWIDDFLQNVMRFSARTANFAKDRHFVAGRTEKRMVARNYLMGPSSRKTAPARAGAGSRQCWMDFKLANECGQNPQHFSALPKYFVGLCESVCNVSPHRRVVSTGVPGPDTKVQRPDHPGSRLLTSFWRRSGDFRQRLRRPNGMRVPVSERSNLSRNS
jgi:hypothetical protein